MDLEPYWDRIYRLRSEHGLSSQRFFEACEGEIGHETLRRFQRDPDLYGGTTGTRSLARYPTAANYEVIARVFGIKPEEFPEYRLAVARNALDDREVGLEVALRNLDAMTGIPQP